MIGNVETISLSDLARVLQADPHIDVLETKGPAEQPTLLIVAMSHERAELLRQQFGNRLIIERDATLNIQPPRPDIP
jgi:hypothetical protein